jgi:hypothetical protein
MDNDLISVCFITVPKDLIVAPVLNHAKGVVK